MGEGAKVLWISIALLLIGTVSSALLNIHLPLNLVNNSWLFEKCPYNEALSANLALFQSSPDERINFFTDHTPHITLFLSDFRTENTTILKQITAKVEEVAANYSTMCSIEWPTKMNAKVVGPYSMVEIPRTPCLQLLSDQFVKALNPFLTKPQPIPEWVNKLPLFSRLRKMYLIEKFGSPNIFADYDPHVTVGYDESATVGSRQAILDSLPGSGFECKAVLTTVAVGQVGVGGSVLQDGFLRQFPLVPSAASDD